jgi:hypothetical protein
MSTKLDYVQGFYGSHKAPPGALVNKGGIKCFYNYNKSTDDLAGYLEDR